MTPSNRGRARIGALVPFTNTNLEPDLALLAPVGVSIHIARMGGYDADAIPDTDQMAGLGATDLDDPLRLLCGARPDVILYGCTSATLAHGPGFDRALAAKICAISGARTITAAGALVDALRALDVRRIGFASPYLAALNDRAIAFLGESGFETVSRADYPVELGNEGQGALTPDEVFELGLRADSEGADALVLSCTDMRAVETIARLEQRIGKPVVSSNQAMMHAAIRNLGLSGASSDFGRLTRQTCFCADFRSETIASSR